jgi:uncharacterized delta-60 repeat protein
MQSEMNNRNVRARLSGALVLGVALASLVGCGEPPDLGEPDAGQTPPDAGTDAGTTQTDTDLALVRLNTNGTVDTTFGTNGIARVDLGPGAGSTRDSVWGMERDTSDRLVLFGGRKASATRSDVDRVVVRLTPNGALDETFATKGIQTLDIANLNDNARHGIIQPDGKIVASGYMSHPTGVGAQSANRIILQRLTDSGQSDATFGSKGVVNSAPIQSADPANIEWGMSESYSVGYQSGKYVTTGYGRPTATGTTVDLLACRYDATGKLDTTWGNNGIYTLDVIGENERGRDMSVLPDDRVLMVGSGTALSQNVDALALLLESNGTPSKALGQDGYKLYDFGRPDEGFLGSAVSADGNWFAAAGHRAGANDDDDAILLIRRVDGSAEFAQAVPLSDTANDRFFSVTFDAAGKVYAAGFLTEGGDNRMVVARFNTDGTRDTTFGMGGVVTVNVAVGKLDESARSVIVQSDGKVVLAGAAESQ